VLPVPPSANQHSSLNLLIGNAQLVINFSYCLYGGARPAARGAGVRTLPHCGPQPANSAQRRPRLGSAASSSRTVPRHPPAPRYRSVPDSAKSAAGDLTRGQTRDWPRGARARALRATQSRRLECSPPPPTHPSSPAVDCMVPAPSPPALLGLTRPPPYTPSSLLHRRSPLSGSASVVTSHSG